MKKEKTVRTYQRRTKTGKVVTVRQHTAKYDAAEKAKEVSKREGAGKELEAKRNKMPNPNLPMDEYLEELKKRKQEVKEESEKDTTPKKVRPVGSGTNGPEPKKKKSEKEPKSTKTSKPTTSEPAFTAAEFKEWYRGTGSAADKKVAKALRAQLGRAGYRKLEDEAIDNYSSRGHLSMFKRVSGGSEVPAKTSKSGAKEKAAEAKVSNSEFTQPPHSTKYKYKGETYYIKRKNVGGLIYKHTDVFNSKGEKLSKDEAAVIKAAQQKSAERADKRGDRRLNGDKEQMRLHGWADMGESTNKANGESKKSGVKETSTKSENVKKETKGDRAVARMHKLVNEALSSTTSDSKALKKQLGALIDYNGGPINRGDKIGKRIDEIREQLGKRSSSKKRVEKKSDYDYEASMRALENYFAEERKRKSGAKAKTSKKTTKAVSVDDVKQASSIHGGLAKLGLREFAYGSPHGSYTDYQHESGKLFRVTNSGAVYDITPTRKGKRKSLPKS